MKESKPSLKIVGAAFFLSPFFLAMGQPTRGATGVRLPEDESDPIRQLTPSSRRSPFIFSEIMYHPSDREDGPNLEFIELYNTEPVAWDIGGFRLEGDIEFTFPPGTRMPGRTFLVVALDPPALQAAYAIPLPLGPWQGDLSNGGGTLRLINRRGAVLLELEYSDRRPWPEAADGLGHSLVLTRPDYGEGDAKAWSASAARGGNPGTMDVPGDRVGWGVVLNEILAVPATGQTPFVELYNTATTALDLAGCTLRNGANDLLLTLDQGTVLSPGDYLVLAHADWPGLGKLDPEGGRLYLLSANEGCVLDAARYRAEAPGVSQGRSPQASVTLRSLAAPTPGSANAGPLSGAIVINEIMYHPISEADADEFIELYNRGAEAVDVGGWRLTSGVRYVIPPATTIPAGGFLVIAADAARLIGRYAQLNAANTLGHFEGQLSNRGETLRLERPLLSTAAPDVTVLVDEVSYEDGEDWGRWADGGGSSLELKDPRSDNAYAGNWAGSDETEKAPWTSISYTGTLDHGSGQSRELEVMLLDAGECLVDDVVALRDNESVNRVTNGDFESGESGWTIEGNHGESRLDARRGSGETAGLHLIATGDGDNLPNCLRASLTTNLRSANRATLGAKARWLCGNRNLLLRLHGNYLEAVGTLDVPDTLGTPGRQNSRYLANSGPVIEETRHAPILPAAGEPITLTAKIHDRDRIGRVTLYWRIDPNPSYSPITMRDDGREGDRLADDGVYSASLAGLPAGTMIGFYLEAEDGASPPARSRFPDEGAPREGLIRVGDELAPGLFGNYKMWVNAVNGEHWSNAPRMSNAMIDGTFVYGGFRVIYDAGIRMRGSGWIRPRTGDPFRVNASYAVRVSKADRILGQTSMTLDNLQQQDVWGRGVLDPTFLRERMTFWLGERLGVETCYQRFILLHLNGTRKGVLYTDTQHPNGDYFNAWFPEDSNGHVFEADSWFEYDNDFPGYKENATLERFTTTGGVLKQAAYRWNWEKKAAHATDDDYAPIFELVDVMNGGPDYLARVDALVDWNQWMRGMAIRRGAAADRDGYGYQAGKNAYLYKGLNSKWKYILWDLDLGFGIERASNAGLFSEIGDPVLEDHFFAEPVFRRAYWRALQDLVDGPMTAEVFDPVADAYYQAFQESGIDTQNPAPAKNWVRDRRAYIVNQLKSLATEFRVTSENGEDFATSQSPYLIEGTAPVKVDKILVNGQEVSLTWTSETEWALAVSLMPGENRFEFQGYDSFGEALEGMTEAVTITLTGQR